MADSEGQLVDISRQVSEKELTVKVREVYDVLFRHKLRILVFFVAVVLTAVGLAVTSHPIYESEAHVLVKRGRESMTLDPTASMGRIVSMHQTWDNILNSELAILTSREIARKTVDRVGVRMVLEGVDDEEGEEAGGLAATLDAIVSTVKGAVRAVVRWPFEVLGWVRPPPSDYEEAIASVYDGVDFSLLRKSSIITMSYRRGNAELARTVLEAFIDSYIEKRIEVYQTPGTMNFFQQQREVLEQEMSAIEKELAPLKSRVAMNSLEEQRTLVLNRINRLLDSIDRAETAKAAAEARVRAIERLQPDLAESDLALAPSGARLPTGREEANEVKLEYIQQGAALAAHEAEMAAYQEQLNTAYEELAALEEPELLKTNQRIRELEREKDLLEARYQAYFESIEQTRIGEALENEKISNISIVQPPTLSKEPVNASKAVKLVLAIVLGLGGGVVIAFLSERMDARLRTPESVEARLQLPTLASIPLLSKSDLQGFGARDAFESLRDRLLLALGNHMKAPTVVGVTSCRKGEGVTTTARQLAVALARDGAYEVLLVDACLAQPGLQEAFDVEEGGGLYDLLEKGAAPVHSVAEHLHLLTAGEADEALSKSFLPERYDALVDYLREGAYHVVVLDMPPVGEGSSTARLAGQLDGVLLVAESEGVRWQVVANAKRLLRESRARVLGVVLNKRRYYVPEWLYNRL